MLDWSSVVREYDLGSLVRGVVHLGAHLAEEAPLYASLDVPVWWIEADPSRTEQIEAVIAPYPNQHLITALVTDKNTGKRAFNVTDNDGMSSSVFKFGTHEMSHPDTHFVDHISLPQRTLDSLVIQHGIEANMLVMDIQGAEGLALKGATQLLASIDFVMSEVNVEEVYKGCARLSDLDAILGDFERTETILTPYGWGDALWVRSSLYPEIPEPVPSPRDTIYMSSEDRAELLRWYGRRFHLEHFIETGTAVGGTTQALLGDFNKLDTIELDRGLYERARDLFRLNDQVTCWHGDSGAILPQLIGSDPILFWLDGHYSGPGTAHGNLDTPIKAELAAAFKAPRGSVILIDDARVFGGGAEHDLEPHYGDYPSLDWVRRAANASGFDYEMRDDVIRLTPR